MQIKMQIKDHAAQAEFFQTIAEEAIMGIMAFHLEGKHCVYVNPLGREILELSADSPLKDFHIDQLKPSNPRGNIRSFSDELLKLEGLVRDVLIERANGVPFVADLGIKTIEETDSILLMFQDVTIQKKLQRELTAKQQEINSAYQELLGQNKQLKELDLAKDRFMALTTHELRTPLAAIVATSEVLNMKLYDNEEQRDDFIHTIHEQATHLMTLVNDILDFTKIQAGKMDFYIQEENIIPVIEMAVTNFEHMAESNHVAIEFQPDVAEMKCYFDRVRIGEVFSNVINNAIKFSKKNTKVNISVAVANDHILVKIADQGQGIKAENLEKVFNEFETIGTIQTHHKGTGLGMPISKRIMDQMGGKIYLESEYGKGTTFFIEIPQTKVLNDSEYRARPEDLEDLLNSV